MISGLKYDQKVTEAIDKDFLVTMREKQRWDMIDEDPICGYLEGYSLHQKSFGLSIENMRTFNYILIRMQV